MPVREVAVGLLVVACASTPVTAQGSARPATVPVRGVVFDSVRGRPLRDAFVTIVGADRSTTTDSRGRFRFDSVEEGARTFAVHHASLDSVGLFGLSRRANVSSLDEEVRVAVPSVATLWMNACGTRAPEDSALIYGTVRDARTRDPVAGAHLIISWVQLTTRAVTAPGYPRGIRREAIDRFWKSETETNASGNFAFCGTPLDAVVHLSAYGDGPSTGDVELPVSDLRVQRHDLAVGARRDENRRGAVVGILADPTGEPFIDARVTLDDTLETRSDFDGRFVFATAPIGTRRLEVRYIGTEPLLSTVDVAPGDTVRTAIEVPRVARLGTTFVTSPERARMVREELEERRIQYRRFIRDSGYVGSRETMANALQGISGLTIRRFNGNELSVLVPDGQGRSCVPDLRIDGVLVNDFGQVNSIPPTRVVSLEVYPRAFDVPSEYMRGGVRHQCGLVAVWTKWALRLP